MSASELVISGPELLHWMQNNILSAGSCTSALYDGSKVYCKGLPMMRSITWGHVDLHRAAGKLAKFRERSGVADRPSCCFDRSL